MTDRQRWQAVLDNDRRYDGTFFYGVASTGIFCRPSCPSRPPRRDRVRFFPTADAALAAGFRPCKRCRPDLTDFSPGQDVAAEAMALLHRHFRDQADLSAALNGLGLSRRRLADLFQAAYGTLHGCLGTLRVTEACRLLRETDQPVAQIAGEAGFDSLSGYLGNGLVQDSPRWRTAGAPIPRRTNQAVPVERLTFVCNRSITLILI